MFFSAKKLTSLVLKGLDEETFDEDNIQNLIYHLDFPSEAVPHFIAEVVCSDPILIKKQDTLGKKLAFGNASILSQFRDLETRANHQIRLGRQINRLAIFMTESKAPTSIQKLFSSLTQRYHDSILFFDERKKGDALAFAAEEIILLEHILSTLESSPELAIQFYEKMFEQLGDSKKRMLANSLLRRMKESETQCSKTKESIIKADSTPPFSEEITAKPHFNTLKKKVTDFLSQWITKSELH